MKTEFSIRHAKNNKTVSAFFQDKADKLAAKYLNRYKGDLIYLHGSLEKNPHKEEYFASLSLYLPSGTLYSRKRGLDMLVALNAAFQDVIRQIRKHKDKLGREKIRRTKGIRSSY